MLSSKCNCATGFYLTEFAYITYKAASDIIPSWLCHSEFASEYSPHLLCKDSCCPRYNSLLKLDPHSTVRIGLKKCQVKCFH